MAETRIELEISSSIDTLRHIFTTIPFSPSELADEGMRKWEYIIKGVLWDNAREGEHFTVKLFSWNEGEWRSLGTFYL